MVRGEGAGKKKALEGLDVGVEADGVGGEEISAEASVEVGEGEEMLARFRGADLEFQARFFHGLLQLSDSVALADDIRDARFRHSIGGAIGIVRSIESRYRRLDLPEESLDGGAAVLRSVFKLGGFSGELFREILGPRAVLEVGLDDLQRAEGGGGGGEVVGVDAAAEFEGERAEGIHEGGWLAMARFRVGERGCKDGG